MRKLEEYKMIDIDRYVRLYCQNSWVNFASKNLDSVFMLDAFNNITHYYDDDNKLIVVDRFYIGD